MNHSGSPVLDRKTGGIHHKAAKAQSFLTKTLKNLVSEWRLTGDACLVIGSRAGTISEVSLAKALRQFRLV